MARRRSRTPAPEYGFSSGAYELDHCSTLVRAGVEEAAAALVAITGANVWERAVQGREVVMRPRAYLVFRPTGHDWAIIVPKNSLRWDQVGEAAELARRLSTRVIAYNGSDSAACYGYDLYEGGDRMEHWYLGEDGEEWESRIRPEDACWDADDGPYEYLDLFFREQKAFEPGWRFVDFLGVRKSQAFETGERWLVEESDGLVERVDWVAAPERRKRRLSRE